jgi:hypothetical protein
MNGRWWYDDFNKSSRHIINEARDKPFAEQCGNRAERSSVDGDRRAGMCDRFCLESRFLYLKIVRQPGGVSRKASDAAISVLQYDDVKLPAASRNLSGDLVDSSE